MSHPAPFPNYVLDAIAMWVNAESRALGRRCLVLDPMAGIGRIHDLPKRIAITYGNEIEPEWANQRPGTIVGDATALPDEWSGMFDVIAVSPVYANRMSDHHEAKDSCAKCKGTGTLWTPDGCADAPFLCPECHDTACACGGYARALKAHVGGCAECRSRRCPSCKGAGVSRRYTYRHGLGRPLSPNNAGQMQWTGPTGDQYRDLHKAAWAEARRVLTPTGLMIVNVKNHIRNGVEQYVSQWHEMTLRDLGFKITAVTHLTAPGMRHGANNRTRVDCEHIIVARNQPEK